MSEAKQPKRKYISREDLHRENRNDEVAICEDYFNQIFKTNRKLDERGQLTVNFRLLSNAGDHMPELYQDDCFEEIVDNLVQKENRKLQENPLADRGLNSKDFSETVLNGFLTCDKELEFMFNDLKDRNGLISFDVVHDLMHEISEKCYHSQHTMDDLRDMINACAEDDRGMNKKEFIALMNSKQF